VAHGLGVSLGLIGDPMEPSIIADLIARLLAIPADKVTFLHFLFLAMGIFGLAIPGLLWGRNQARHVQFIREATPEQLAAYMGNHKLPPPKAPSLGGPVVILGLLLVVGLARGASESLARSGDEGAECQRDRDCPAGQYCHRGSCVSNARKPVPKRMAVRGPLGLAFEERDPEAPTVGWVHRNF